MIGICPNCGIKLKQPPFNKRETNEILITLKYRKFIDNDLIIPRVDETGFCEICSASLEDLEEQKILEKGSIPIS